MPDEPAKSEGLDDGVKVAHTRQTSEVGVESGAPAVANQNASVGEDKLESAEEDIDLFGSDDDEEEGQEVTRVREQRLREYKERKVGKAKPAAKTAITMDVKSWGE